MIGRLAFRVENNFWVAYYAMPNTMEGAIEMGRIALTIVENADRKRAFMDIMKSALGDFFRSKFDAEGITWIEKPAPEREDSSSKK
jgi:hypothetical protein